MELLIGYLIFGVVTGYVAHQRGRSFLGWSIIGTFLPLLAFVPLLLMKRLNSFEQTQGVDSKKDRILEIQNNFAEKLKTPKSVNPYRMDPTDAIERGVVLLNKEELIIDIPGYMARSVKTGAEWKSGNKGVRIKPSKYFGFSLGGSKGKMVSSTEFQKDFGYFTLTTKKLIFTGETHKFSIPLSKIDNISRDEATVLFDVTSRDVPDFHGVFITEDTAKLLTGFISDPNMEITGL